MNKFKVGDLVIRSVKSNWPEWYGKVGEVGTVTIVTDYGALSVFVSCERELINTDPHGWSHYAHSYTEEDLESIIG
jgi:hypothetical protein